MAKLNRSKDSVRITYLTSEGLKDAHTEVEFLKTTKRAQVAERIQRARELGDVAENAEYDAALDEQTLIEGRIVYLEEVLRNAKIISESHSNDFVVIGSTVKVQMDEGVDEFTIVGKMEANPAKKRISNESPLGSALLGAKPGEEVEVTTPIIHYKAKVLEIK